MPSLNESEMNTLGLLLLQNIKDGMEAGRLTDITAIQTEIDSAIAELHDREITDDPEHPGSNEEAMGQMLLEIGELRETVTKCQAQLADVETQAKALKEDTAQMTELAEACHLLVQQQRREHAELRAAVEEARADLSIAPPTCVAPPPSPVGPVMRPASPKTALVCFPGGPRTVTIHPPGSPDYQSVVRDETGHVIIDFRRPKPLRREGAFRCSLDRIDLEELTHVHGRRAPGPEPPTSYCGAQFLDASHHRCVRPGPSRMGRPRRVPVLIADLASSSNDVLQEIEVSTALLPTPPTPSPTLWRGKKRARNVDEEDEDVAHGRERGTPLIERTVLPIPVPSLIPRRDLFEEARRKRRRSSEANAVVSLSRTRSSFDLRHTV